MRLGNECGRRRETQIRERQQEATIKEIKEMSQESRSRRKFKLCYFISFSCIFHFYCSNGLFFAGGATSDAKSHPQTQRQEPVHDSNIKTAVKAHTWSPSTCHMSASGCLRRRRLFYSVTQSCDTPTPTPTTTHAHTHIPTHTHTHARARSRVICTTSKDADRHTLTKKAKSLVAMSEVPRGTSLHSKQ